MATIVFIILQIFFATRAVLKIGEYFPVFGHVTRLDQSRASEQIWWIYIINDEKSKTTARLTQRNIFKAK